MRVQPRGRWRELLLRPDSKDAPDKPTREQLSGMSRADRRRAKVAYQSSGGVFRTWVYVVVLVVLVGGFALYLIAVG